MHWDRVVAMAATLRCTCAAATSSADALSRGVHAGFALWAAKNPMNPNWWWNEIGVPGKVQKASVLMKDQLSVGDRTSIMSTCSYVPRHSLPWGLERTKQAT